MEYETATSKMYSNTKSEPIYAAAFEKHDVNHERELRPSAILSKIEEIVLDQGPTGFPYWK